MHPSLIGSYITKLRAFTVQAEAEGRLARNRDPAWLSSLQKGPAHPREVRQQDPDDGSPHCKARRAMSPRTSDVPAVHVSPAAASLMVPRSLLYDGRPPILPVTIRVQDLVDDDVTSSDDLPSVLAHPEGPASSPASHSPSRSFRHVAVSSGDSRSGDSVHHTSPVLMVDSKPAVMSVFSSDTDPDMEDKLSQFQPLQVPVLLVFPNASMGVMESPLSGAGCARSAVSLAWVSPGRDREVSSSVMLDVFRVYENSPNTSYYVTEGQTSLWPTYPFCVCSRQCLSFPAWPVSSSSRTIAPCMQKALSWNPIECVYLLREDD